ncbi:MAG: PQQ-dependent sugar dehydrogenase [Roseimicrobium sp.]
MHRSLSSLYLLGLLALNASVSPSQDTPCQLVPAFPNLKIERPITVVMPSDGTQRLFLAQQRGKVLILPKDETSAEATTFLDLSGRKMEASEGSKFEEGLDGMAFHPKFAQNGKFYLFYTQQDPKRAVISEMQVSKDDANKADPASERVLLEVRLPWWWHHSGNIAFGPDGMLYIALGDGGGKDGDPLRWGQNLFVMNGKVLRIDVDGKTGARNYGIPSDNPFVGKDAAHAEVWAYGFRNPWGMSFDAAGNLWLADVGQELWEEINLVEKGGNYGWSHREGMVKYHRRTDEPPADAKFVDPVFVYDHAAGISITGGIVYRGEKLPQIKGTYIYGDWGFGRVWALNYDTATKKVVSNQLLVETALLGKPGKERSAFQPTAFCEDMEKEVLALDWNGKIYRLAK